MRAQGGEGRLGDLPSLCSSDESIPDLYPFSEDEVLYEGLDQESPLQQATSSAPNRKDIHEFSLPTSRVKDNELLMTRKRDFEYSHYSPGAVNSSTDVGSSSCVTSNEVYVQRKKENEMQYAMRTAIEITPTLSSTGADFITTRGRRAPVSRSNSKGRIIEYSLETGRHLEDALSPIVDTTRQGRVLLLPHFVRDEVSFQSSDRYGRLKQTINSTNSEMYEKLGQLSLAPDTGSCSVLEVIEPSSDESDEEIDQERNEQYNLNETPEVIPAQSEDVSTRPKNIQDRRMKRMFRSKIHQGLGGLSYATASIDKQTHYEGTTSSDSGGAAEPMHRRTDIQSPPQQSNHQKQLSQHQHQLKQPHPPNTVQKSSGVDQQQQQTQQHFLANEVSGGTVGSDASESHDQRNIPNTAKISSNIPDDPDNTMKRKSFLHKFSIKPKWPSNKRKVVKPVRKEERGKIEQTIVASLSHMMPSLDVEYNERSVDRLEPLENIRHLPRGSEDHGSKPDIPIVDKIERVLKKEDRSLDRKLRPLAVDSRDSELFSTPEVSTTSSSQDHSPNNSSHNSSEESSVSHSAVNIPHPAPKSQLLQVVQQSSVRQPLKQVPQKFLSQQNSRSLHLQRQQIISAQLEALSDSNSTPPPVPPTRRPPPPPTRNFHTHPPFNQRLSKDNLASSLSKEILLEETSEEGHQDSSKMVARPESSASKFELLSRPGSSSSSFPVFKNDHLHLQNLHKSTLSLTQDLLPATDSITVGRMSPAPSEVSKTESALSPPSHASDVSKSESTRQLKTGGSLSSSVSATQSNSSIHGKDLAAEDAAVSTITITRQHEANISRPMIENISSNNVCSNNQNASEGLPTSGIADSKKLDGQDFHTIVTNRSITVRIYINILHLCS